MFCGGSNPSLHGYRPFYQLSYAGRLAEVVIPGPFVCVTHSPRTSLLRAEKTNAYRERVVGPQSSAHLNQNPPLLRRAGVGARQRMQRRRRRRRRRTRMDARRQRRCCKR